MAESLVKAILKPRKARPFFGRHPWVYAGAIDRVEGQPQCGDAVALHTDRGEFVATGLVNPASNLRIRLYRWDEPAPLADDVVADRVRAAVRLRHETLGLGDPEAGCRLVYSESDGLSGLVVDRWAGHVVVQWGSAALRRFEDVVTRTLVEELSPASVQRRIDRQTAELERMDADDALLHGTPPSGPVEYAENGLRWLADLTGGQKTGGYHDQRDNRAAVASLAAGRDVLDLYCYAGGFGVTALSAGAKSVTFVDSSEAALALAERNATLNGVAGEFVAQDAVAALDRLHDTKRRFGMVLCDPPKFAHAAGQVDAALRGYRSLFKKALAVLEPGGILVACNCTGRIDAGTFHDTLAEVARHTGRHLRILESRGAAADHPVSAFCPQTAYLQCVVAAT